MRVFTSYAWPMVQQRRLLRSKRDSQDKNIVIKNPGQELLVRDFLCSFVKENKHKNTVKTNGTTTPLHLET